VAAAELAGGAAAVAMGGPSDPPVFTGVVVCEEPEPQPTMPAAASATSQRALRGIGPAEALPAMAGAVHPGEYFGGDELAQLPVLGEQPLLRPDGR
jgi:hypothetical protein